MCEGDFVRRSVRYSYTRSMYAGATLRNCRASSSDCTFLPNADITACAVWRRLADSPGATLNASNIVHRLRVVRTSKGIKRRNRRYFPPMPGALTFRISSIAAAATSYAEVSIRCVIGRFIIPPFCNASVISLRARSIPRIL
uniref:Uncharacterized protein n=1 Tax=Klebsiella phage HenuGS TaxID=3350566 RepID=A0AB74UKB6_9CAUD